MPATAWKRICLIWCMSGSPGSRPPRSLLVVLLRRCTCRMRCCWCLGRRLWFLFVLLCVVSGWVGLVVGGGFVGVVGESITVARALRRGVRPIFGAYSSAPTEA